MEFNRKRRRGREYAIKYADNWGDKRRGRRLGIGTLDWCWQGGGRWRGEKQLDCAGRNRFHYYWRKQNFPIGWRSNCWWRTNWFGQKFLKSGRPRWIFLIVTGLWNQQWDFCYGQQFDRLDNPPEPSKNSREPLQKLKYKHKPKLDNGLKTNHSNQGDALRKRTRHLRTA